MNDDGYISDFSGGDLTDPLEQDSVLLYEGLDFYTVKENIERFTNSERHTFYWDTFHSANIASLISCIDRFLYRSESKYLNRKPLIIVRAIGQLWKQRESDLESLYNEKYPDSYYPIKDAAEMEAALIEFIYEDEDEDYNGEKLFMKAFSTIRDEINVTETSKDRLVKTWFLVHHLAKSVVSYYEERFYKKFHRETLYFDHFEPELNNSLLEIDEDFAN